MNPPAVAIAVTERVHQTDQCRAAEDSSAGYQLAAGAAAPRSSAGRPRCCSACSTRPCRRARGTGKRRRSSRRRTAPPRAPTRPSRHPGSTRRICMLARTGPCWRLATGARLDWAVGPARRFLRGALRCRLRAPVAAIGSGQVGKLTGVRLGPGLLGRRTARPAGRGLSGRAGSGGRPSPQRPAPAAAPAPRHRRGTGPVERRRRRVPGRATVAGAALGRAVESGRECFGGRSAWPHARPGHGARREVDGSAIRSGVEPPGSGPRDAAPPGEPPSGSGAELEPFAPP